MDDIALKEGKVCVHRRELRDHPGWVSLDKLYDDRLRVWSWLADSKDLARVMVVLQEIRDGGTGERRQGAMGSRRL